MMKQQRLCVNDELNNRKQSNVNIDEINPVKNYKLSCEEISKDRESSAETSSPHNGKKEKGNKKNVWSKVSQ
jgi:hypothetical protein